MDSVSQKHDYNKPEKRRAKLLDDYDPRPIEYRGTTSEHLPSILKKIKGQQLSISLMLDRDCCHKESDEKSPKGCQIPHIAKLKEIISAFKQSLQVSEDKIREIELNTRDQRHTPLWYSTQQYRLITSQFGRILSRKSDTPPDKLVLQLIQSKSVSTPALNYGIESEPLAIKEYVKYQHSHGHHDLMVSPCGFHTSATHPFLGASPDGVVYDPQQNDQSFGFLEVKCPYTCRDLLPVEGCSVSGFCCACNPATSTLQLKTNGLQIAGIHFFLSPNSCETVFLAQNSCEPVFSTSK